jgi:hypothetical protein
MVREVSTEAHLGEFYWRLFSVLKKQKEFYSPQELSNFSYGVPPNAI